MEIQKVTAVVVIDLSATFDTVDHKIILGSILEFPKAVVWVPYYSQPTPIHYLTTNHKGSP